MSLTCGFFNAEDGDRQYFNSDLSNFLEGLIEDGIYAFIGDKMMVTEASPTPNMTVNVGSGRAWFNGTWTKIDTAYQVNIPASDSVQSRIDALCLTINKTRAVRDNYIEIIQGTGSVSNPTKPTVEDEPNIFRHVLCYITVPAACTAITQAQIENRIGMDTALFTTPKWGDVPTTEQMVAQWQAEFDQFMDHIHQTFDYDAAGKLQVGVDNFAPTYISELWYNYGSIVLDNNVLKRCDNDSSTFSALKAIDLFRKTLPDASYRVNNTGRYVKDIVGYLDIDVSKITPHSMIIIRDSSGNLMYKLHLRANSASSFIYESIQKINIPGETTFNIFNTVSISSQEIAILNNGNNSVEGAYAYNKNVSFVNDDGLLRIQVSKNDMSIYQSGWYFDFYY